MSNSDQTLPPLVLLHGFLSDHTLWNGVVTALDQRIHVIAPDFPGFGNTPALGSEPSIEGFADHIVNGLRAHGVKKAFIAGMSMGGYVALAIAERHPELLAGLGLISTQAAADTPVKRRLRSVTIAAVRRRGIEAVSDDLFAVLFAPSRPCPPDLMRVAIEAAHRSSPDGVCWALEAMAHRPDRTKMLQFLQVPGLVVHGLEDQIMPAELAREMAAVLPTARLVEIPQVGHATPWEAPEILAREFSAWVTN